MDWATLRDRSPDAATIESVRAALATRRASQPTARESAGPETQPSDSKSVDSTEGDDAVNDSATGAATSGTASVSDPREPRPTRVVADADVLAVDALGFDPATNALELLWTHSWTTLVASDPLVADTEAVLTRVADADFATDWRVLIDRWREPISQPAGDHPALASAYRGGAMHLLSFDDELTGSAPGASLTSRFPVSVRQPAAFAAVFDPAGLYETTEPGSYRGPDRDPRGSDR